MFTRTIEVNLKPNTTTAFFKTFRTEVLPILKKTTGFFDIVVLNNENEPNKVFTISFWETKKNAEYYEKEWYPKVKATIEQYFTTPPVVKNYTLEETFTEKLFTTTTV
jgi:heme-degrading monooxygenase HmoA